MIKRLKSIAAVAVAVALGAYFFAPPPQNASAQFSGQSTYVGTSGGTANALTLTIANMNTLVVGVPLTFIVGNTNTGPAVIVVSGTASTAILRPSSIGNVALSGGELTAGEFAAITYNGTQFVLTTNVDVTPIGRTIEFRGATTPRGALIEDGSCVSRTTFAPLFTVIGTTYGACDGSTTFAVPDSRGTTFAALDGQGANGLAGRLNATSGCSTSVIATPCGSQFSALIANNVPALSVTGSFSGGGTGTSAPGQSTGGGGGSPQAATLSGGSANPGLFPVSVTVSGSISGTANSGSPGTAFSNVMPALIGRRAIKY